MKSLKSRRWRNVFPTPRCPDPVYFVLRTAQNALQRPFPHSLKLDQLGDLGRTRSALPRDLRTLFFVRGLVDEQARRISAQRARGADGWQQVLVIQIKRQMAPDGAATAPHDFEG